jgi:phosphatidate cytidylyltransferase
VVRVLRRRHPERDWSELGSRTRSWWVMASLFTAAMLLSPTAAVVLFGFVSFLALKEYLSLIPTRRADRRVLFWAYLAVPVQYYWAGVGAYGMFLVFIPVYLFLLLPFRMVTIGETRDFLRAAGTLHWGLMTTVFSLSHVAFLLALPASGNPAGGGPGLVLYLVALTELNDVAQYVWGKRLGRRRIVPRVSPNKTWEGFLGGVATTVVLAWLLAPLLTPLDTPLALAAGLLIGVGGFFGDVTVSALKRDLGVKDSGSLLPGHGGVLDRVDSLTYTAPLFFHFIHFFRY